MAESLSEESLIAKEPFAQFQNWFDLACQTLGNFQPNIFCLATAAKNGRPSCRMAMLQGFDKDGFKFCTCYDSRKGKELAENPFVALTFFWLTLRRQVRIEGAVIKMPNEQSIQYFNSMPKIKQLTACASLTSEQIAGREELENKFQMITNKYSDSSVLIPKPDNWGGFLVVPDSIEFWQERKNKTTDRIRFRKPTTRDVIDNKLVYAGDDEWIYERLSP